MLFNVAGGKAQALACAAEVLECSAQDIGGTERLEVRGIDADKCSQCQEIFLPVGDGRARQTPFDARLKHSAIDRDLAFRTLDQVGFVENQTTPFFLEKSVCACAFREDCVVGCDDHAMELEILAPNFACIARTQHQRHDTRELFAFTSPLCHQRFRNDDQRGIEEFVAETGRERRDCLAKAHFVSYNATGNTRAIQFTSQHPPHAIGLVWSNESPAKVSIDAMHCIRDGEARHGRCGHCTRLIAIRRQL